MTALLEPPFKAKDDDLDTEKDETLPITSSHAPIEDDSIVSDSKCLKCLERVFTKKILQLFAELSGEFIGTFLLTLIITTVVATDVLLGAEVSLWNVAFISGMGVGLSIYSTAYFSNSHLNPAVTMAFGIVRWRVFSWKKIIPYILIQFLGGFLAAAMTYAMYWDSIALFESKNGIVRGENASVLTASIFGTYFPNPSYKLYQNRPNDAVSPFKAMVIEAWGTALLVFMIFSFSDPSNSSVGSSKSKVAVPVLIGLTVSVIISLYAPLTQAGLNPARDFGPRLFATMAGWGRVAIPGPRNGSWVYIVGPIIGGPLGGILYDWVVARMAKRKNVVEIVGQ